MDTLDHNFNSFAPSARTLRRANIRPLHAALWIAQVLLALAFGAAGFMKLTTPIAEMAQHMAWVADAPALVRFIGAMEVLGAIGLILPALTRIVPVLTVWAGAGLALIMVLALGLHVYRGEWSAITAPFVLGALASFIVWGRATREPIAPRPNATRLR